MQTQASVGTKNYLKHVSQMNFQCCYSPRNLPLEVAKLQDVDRDLENTGS